VAEKLATMTALTPPFQAPTSHQLTPTIQEIVDDNK
jgi:hypothetical protein